MRARMEHAHKQVAFEGKRVQFYNKEVAASKQSDRNIVGLSRDYSDAARQARYVAETARKTGEGLAIAGRRELGGELDLKGGESVSNRRGMADYKKLLYAQSRLENAIDHTFSEKAARVNSLIGRGYQARRAANRAALGLPPNPIQALTFMPPKDRAGQMWANLQMAVSIASTVAGFGKKPSGGGQGLNSIDSSSVNPFGNFAQGGGIQGFDWKSMGNYMD